MSCTSDAPARPQRLPAAISMGGSIACAPSMHSRRRSVGLCGIVFGVSTAEQEPAGWRRKSVPAWLGEKLVPEVHVSTLTVSGLTG